MAKTLKKNAPAMVKSFLFVPLAKVDEVERTVTGIVTSEVLDKSGEYFHYESSVPYFKAWSATMERVTKGKSLGNVRSMHQPNAVGKLTAIEFDDGNKTITATAKIVDDAEWTKVVEGVYTGFSIGGKYVKQWEEGGKNYFTADPVEVSIVDNPCVPVAHFLAVKAEGVEETVKFKLFVPTNGEVADRATEMAKAASTDALTRNWVEFVEFARAALKAEHGIPKDREETPEEVALKAEEADKTDKPADQSDADKPDDAGDADKATMTDEEKDAKKKKDDEDAAAKAEADAAEKMKEDGVACAAPLTLVKQAWLATDGTPFEKKADAVAHETDLQDPVKLALAKANAVVADVSKAQKPYGEVAYAYEKGDVARFPVDSELHIRSSWVFANKADFLGDDKPAVLEVIVKAWAEKIGGTPPTLAQLDVFISDKDKAAEAVKALHPEKLEKGMYLVSMWASLIDQILWASDFTGWCHEDSELPQSTKDICAAVLTFMVELVNAEVGIALSHLKVDGIDKLTGLQKVVAEAIAANPSTETIIAKADYDKLTGDHDALKAHTAKVEKQVEQAVEGITALTAEVEKLKKQPEPRKVGRVVDKADDRLDTNGQPVTGEAYLTELLKTHTPQELALMVVKAAQRNPQNMMPKKD